MKLSIFQIDVATWMEKTFSFETRENKRERGYRFLEEALELFQSLNLEREDALKLVDYVFSRPKGEPVQEVGGVMITLAALCEAADISLKRAAVDELERVNSPEVIAKIKSKRATRAVPGDYKGEPAPKVKCSRCEGKGQWLQPGNLHESEGWVPCRDCGGSGLAHAK